MDGQQLSFKFNANFFFHGVQCILQQYLSIKRCILSIGGMGWVLLWIWVWCRHCSDDCLLVQFKESTRGQEDTQSEVMSNFDTFIHQQCLPEQYWGLSGKLGTFCNIHILPGYITLRFIMICLFSPSLLQESYSPFSFNLVQDSTHCGPTCILGNRFRLQHQA